MAAQNDSFEVLVATSPPIAVEETIFSHQFCLYYLREFAAPALVKTVPREELLTVEDLLCRSCADLVLIVQDPETLMTPTALTMLPRLLLEHQWKALAPVSNYAPEPSQRALPPFLYHNVRNLIEVADLVWENVGKRISPAPASSDWPCLVICRSELDPVDAAMPLADLWDQWAEAGRIGRAEGIYVHRFGDYYAASRDDLIDLVPDRAHRILDIGCARGFLGKALKEQRNCRLTGVEINPIMAEEAARTYDRIYNLPIEDVAFDQTFDAIICGDLIEHLRDPLQMLLKLRNILQPGGCLIGSVPNAGHWSIVQDLARGRFEMIPVGLLCMSHLRFFTAEELNRLLTKAGLTCDHMETDRPQPTPSGEAFIRLLVEAECGNEDSLRTAELRFRAIR